MKVFYKEHESKKVYVQVGDLIALANINAAMMPSTVKAKTLDNIDCDEKEFVGFEAPEEIAFRNGWVTREQLIASAELYGKSPYGAHLKAVADEKVKY